MNKQINPMDGMVKCDLCKKEFHLNRSNLTEEKIVLHKGDESYVVSLTQLTCPICGKHYPVVVDDAETTKIVEEYRAALVRYMKYTGACKPVPSKLVLKCQKLNQKLDFKRRLLAKKFDGAFYQSEGKTIQLDYRYHTR